MVQDVFAAINAAVIAANSSPGRMHVGIFDSEVLPPSCSQAAEAAALAVSAVADALAAALINVGRALWKRFARPCERITRSCGRLGPAKLDSTVLKSRLKRSEYCGFGRFLIVE
jgi:predicted lipoprotein